VLGSSNKHRWIGEGSKDEIYVLVDVRKYENDTNMKQKYKLWKLGSGSDDENLRCGDSSACIHYVYEEMQRYF